MTATIWTFLALCLATFIIGYLLETWWMIGWASYVVAKTKIIIKRLVK